MSGYDRENRPQKPQEPEVIKVDGPLEPWEGRARDYRPNLSGEFKKRQKHARDTVLLELKKYEDLSEDRSEKPKKKKITIKFAAKGSKDPHPTKDSQKDSSQFEGLKSNLEKQTHAYSDLEEKYSQGKKQWQREKDLLDRKIHQLEGSLIALESQLQINNHRIEEIQRQHNLELEKIAEQRDFQKEKNLELERQLEYEKKKRKALHGVLNKNIQENFVEAEKVAEVDRERHNLMRRISVYEEEKQLLESEKNRLNKKIEKLQEDIRNYVCDLREEKSARITLENNNRLLTEKLDDLNSSYEQIKQQKEFIENRLQQYKKSRHGRFLEGDEIVGSYDSYVIEGPFEKGGMGDLFLAKRHSNSEQVVIKTLQLKDEGDENKKLLRFIQEARMLMTCDHPNLVKGIDFQQSPESIFLVMEYLKGLTIEQMFSQMNVFDEKKAAKTILQVAKGLQCLERMGIVHRDIKPSNIMITDDDRVKLMDFGILKHSSTKCILTTSGIIMGTPYYLSPEQITDERVSAKSDIYSLGVTFYHMVVGDVPFRGENHVEVIAQRLTKNAVKPSKMNPHLSKDIVDLIENMMERKPNKRPSPMGVIEKLESFLKKST